jgi:hypothetical protein
LKYFIHLGPLLEMGALSFQELFLKDPLTSHVDSLADQLKDDTPFYTRVNKGPVIGQVHVQGPVELGKILDLPSWQFANHLVKQQYIEF